MTLTRDRAIRIGRLAVPALAVVLTILAVASAARRETGHRRIAELLDRYRATLTADDNGETAAKTGGGEEATSKNAPGKNDPKGKKPNNPVSPQDKQVERISKRNVFSPAPPEKAFAGKLIGVLGNLAFFDDGAGCGVGETYKDGKVKRIGPDWVEIEFDGKTQRVEVFAKEGKGGPGPGPSGPSMAPRMRGGPMVMPAGPPPPSGGMPPGFQLPPEMIEQFRNMPPELRQKQLERMPAELREKLQQAL